MLRDEHLIEAENLPSSDFRPKKVIFFQIYCLLSAELYFCLLEYFSIYWMSSSCLRDTCFEVTWKLVLEYPLARRIFWIFLEPQLVNSSGLSILYSASRQFFSLWSHHEDIYSSRRIRRWFSILWRPNARCKMIFSNHSLCAKWVDWQCFFIWPTLHQLFLWIWSNYVFWGTSFKSFLERS